MNLKSLEYLWMILTHPKIWSSYKRRVLKQEKIVDFETRQPDHLRDVLMVYGSSILNSYSEEFTLPNGKEIVLKLIKYYMKDDEFYLIRKAQWQMISLKEGKLISDMSFPEYVSLLQIMRQKKG